MRLRRKHLIAGMTFVAFKVEHSLHAPAVGYRIAAGHSAIFYCPDLVQIHDRRTALRGITAYIGDGATIARPLVLRRSKHVIGHAPIDVQLEWCKKSRVPRAIITHCGTQIVTADKSALQRQINELSHKHGLRVDVAEDGLALTLRRGPKVARS